MSVAAFSLRALLASLPIYFLNPSPYFTDATRLIEFSSTSGIVIGLFSACLSTALLRKTSQAHIVLGQLSLTMPIALSVLIYVFAYHIDIDLDNSTAHRCTVDVLEKYRTTGKGAHNVLGVSDWVHAGEEAKISNPGQAYYQANVGDQLTVFEKPGYLGYHWVRQFTSGVINNAN